MQGKKKAKDRDLVLVIRVWLREGFKLTSKGFFSTDPYCKVWVGPKGMMEPPEKGYYVSTVQENTLSPEWGKGKASASTKDLFKSVGSEFMIPPTESNQDCWTFLWKEGHVIHVQIWDKNSNSYMGNAAFPVDISKTVQQSATEKVHNGPPGQLRSKEKVSGTVTVAWEWATKTDQLHIDQWIPLLRQLTFDDDRALSFLRQEDLLPHVSLPVARFILGQIAKGYVIFPSSATFAPMKSGVSSYRSSKIITNVYDWEREFADENEDGGAQEPDGLVFIQLHSKVISFDYFEKETIWDLKTRLSASTSAKPSDISFYSVSKKLIEDSELAENYSSLTFVVGVSGMTLEEFESSFREEQQLSSSSSSSSSSLASSNPRAPPLPPMIPKFEPRATRAATLAISSQPGPDGAPPPKPARVANVGLVTRLASILFKEDYVSLSRVMSTLSMDKLTTVTPILVGCQHPDILKLIKEKVEESEAFGNRVRMIQNMRYQFSYLDTLVGHIPLSNFLNVFLDKDLSFSQGQVFKINSIHPLTNKPIDEVKVVKIFSSLAQPSILSLNYNGELQPPMTLFKRGEDLYSETCLQVLFQYMNEIWEASLPEDIRPKIFGLRELPGSTERGFLEIVPEVRDLEIVERGDMELITPENDENFIRTTCGWVLASYFLGLSDRHRENTLVRISDGSAIPIDFGFILGNQPPSYNTFCITVSPDMYRYLLRKDKWVWFSLMFLAGFWAVRAHAQEFIRLAIHLFQGVERDLEVSARFISYRMVIGKDLSKAMSQIYSNLRHAPICFFTKKKIEGHCKAKKIPARQDFIGSLARKIGTNAARPEKAEEKTGGEAGDSLHSGMWLSACNESDSSFFFVMNLPLKDFPLLIFLSPGKVDLPLPMQYPDNYPGELVALLVSLMKARQK
jgi:hypothetical protein